MLDVPLYLYMYTVYYFCHYQPVWFLLNRLGSLKMLVMDTRMWVMVAPPHPRGQAPLLAAQAGRTPVIQKPQGGVLIGGNHLPAPVIQGKGLM